jgi:hypothetical protein
MEMGKISMWTEKYKMKPYWYGRGVIISAIYDFLHE